MAKTYSAIQTYTLTANTSSVTFSNIPQNFTDLKIVISARGSAEYAATNLKMQVGNATVSTSGYSEKLLYTTNGTSVVGYGQSAQVQSDLQYFPLATSTANTFSNNEIYIPNYTGSNAKSFNIDSVSEDNTTAVILAMTAGLSSNTSAINIITFTPNTGNFAQYSTFTLYGIGTGAKATGGTITGAGNYIYHTFTSTSTFTPLEKIKNAEILVIAGGGGGGRFGGGGGAGGLCLVNAQSLLAGTPYVCRIGSGGSGSTSRGARGVNGNNSQFSSLTAAVGGGGGGSGDSSFRTGSNGGSGGGGGSDVGSAGGSPTSGQGFAGGAAISDSTGYCGGGGGAGAAGSVGHATTLGNGGIGSASYSSWGLATLTGQIVGSIAYFAGGGGGGTNGSTTSYGGAGGGGAGSLSTSNATAALVNTGGGGGGSRDNNAGGGNGAAGGSGLIIVRYPIN
jgi:hypothetical protein